MTAIAIQSQAAIAETTALDRLLEKWTAFIDASPRTVKAYTKNVGLFLSYLRENGIVRPERKDVLEYRAFLKASYKPSTVNSYLIAVKLFFQWLAAEGLYADIAGHVKGARVGQGFKKDALTTRQAGKVLGGIDRSTVAGKRDYAIVALMVTTGLRTISVINADCGDIRTVADDTVLFFKGKGADGKGQYVKLAEPVMEAIADYLQARGPADESEPLFASDANRNRGGRMTTRSISRIAKDAMIDAGLVSTRLTAHSLRHTAATLALLNGASLAETQQLLGHKSISTTMIYNHSLQRAANNAEYRISDAVFGGAA